MSIADEFLSKHQIDSTNSYIDSTQTRGSIEYSGNSYFRNYQLNPRQNEFYAKQNAHQERLNYLHFMHRLNGEKNKNDNFDDFRNFDPLLPNPQIYEANFTKSKHDEEESEEEEEKVSQKDLEREKKLKEEESELKAELLRQQALLDETKYKIGNEVDKIKALLEKFRKDRQSTMRKLEIEYSKRKERYQSDISMIRNTEPKKPEINITFVEDKSHSSRMSPHTNRISRSSRHSHTSKRKIGISSMSEISSETIASDV